ncbi:MAG: HNH endonuclease [Gemmatimonadetes bacterium]|nr:HNH endonuclease [Gemmatimonadota bacterium]
MLANVSADQDPDHIEELGEQIAVLAAHIHAATQRMLALIAEFDQLRGWERSGHRDCAEWLSARTGIDHGACQEKVRAARALTRLPITRAAMGRGELSFSKVRALTRIAEPGNERELVDLARGVTAAQLERMVRAWKKGRRQDEAARERARFESRTLSVYPDDDGMYVVKARLTPEVGAALRRAIEAAGDALYREKPNPLASDEERRREAAQRRADGIGLVAERALAAGFGTGVADAATSGGAGAPVSGSRAERYQVVLHVDADTLSADGEPGHSELDDGTRLSAESARRLACDASLVKVAQKPDGTVLDVGRKTRTISPALRRALEARDGGCRFSGCGRRFTDAHHVKHWADGGETSLRNTLLLCRHHHRLVHECGWTMGWDGEGRPVFFDTRGHMHYDGRWQLPELHDDAADGLLKENLHLGIEPDGWTASARWEREKDIPDEVYFAATGAV